MKVREKAEFFAINGCNVNAEVEGMQGCFLILCLCGTSASTLSRFEDEAFIAGAAGDLFAVEIFQ